MNRIYTRTGDSGTTGIHGGARVPKDDIRIEANGELDELNCQIGVVRSLLRCRVKPGMTDEGQFGMTEGGSAGGPGGEATVLSGQTPPAARNGSGFATERCRIESGMTDEGQFGMTEGGSVGGPGGEATVLSGQTPPAARNGSGFAAERCRVKPGMTGKCILESGMTEGGIIVDGMTDEGWDEVLHQVQCQLMTVMSLVATPAAERDKNPNTLPDDLVTRCEATMDALTEESGPSLHFLLPGGTPLAAQLQLARAVCRRAERRLWTLHRQDPVPETILQYINRLSDLLFVMARQELARQKWPEERWKAFSYKNQR